MKSINFNSGIKTYAVNGDESNVIKVNISDINIAQRIKETEEKIDKIGVEIDNGVTAEQLSAYDKEIKDLINYTFGTDICTPAFGNANVFSITEEGKFLFEAFFEAFVPIITEDIQNYKMVKKSEKFNSVISNAPAVDTPANQFTEEEKVFLRQKLGI